MNYRPSPGVLWVTKEWRMTRERDTANNWWCNNWSGNETINGQKSFGKSGKESHLCGRKHRKLVNLVIRFELIRFWVISRRAAKTIAPSANSVTHFQGVSRYNAFCMYSTFPRGERSAITTRRRRRDHLIVYLPFLSRAAPSPCCNSLLIVVRAEKDLCARSEASASSWSVSVLLHLLGPK